MSSLLPSLGRIAAYGPLERSAVGVKTRPSETQVLQAEYSILSVGLGVAAGSAVRCWALVCSVALRVAVVRLPRWLLATHHVPWKGSKRERSLRTAKPDLAALRAALELMASPR